MSRRLALVRLLFACAAALPAVSLANEESQSASLDWHCTQEFDAFFHVLCRPRAVGGAQVAVATPASDAVVAAPEQRVSDMRPVAQRGDHEVFSADAWRVPLHSRPTDSRAVVQLLESVLCGRRARCAVHYDAPPVRTARR